QRKRAGSGGVGELAARDVEAVLGNRIRGQQPQHAVARLRRLLFPLPLLARPLLALLWRLRRPAWTLLRTRERGRTGDQQRQEQTPGAKAAGLEGGNEGHRGVLGDPSG